MAEAQRITIAVVALRAERGWDLLLEVTDPYGELSGPKLITLGKGYAHGVDAVQAFVDTLTAPLVAQEKLNQIEELTGRLGALSDLVQEQHEEIEHLKSTQSHQGSGPISDDIRALALRVLGQAPAEDPGRGAVRGSGSQSGPPRVERAVPAPLRRPQAQVHQPAGGAYAPRGEDNLPPGEDD